MEEDTKQRNIILKKKGNIILEKNIILKKKGNIMIDVVKECLRKLKFEWLIVESPYNHH